MIDFEAMNAMMEAETTPIVKIWMNWMVLTFLASLVFIAKFKPARWAFATIIGTMLLALLTWVLTQNVHLFAVPHLILWTPLAFYIWKTALSPAARTAAPAPSTLYGKAHQIWLILLFATILISLVFDVRDVWLVLTGAK